MSRQSNVAPREEWTLQPGTPNYPNTRIEQEQHHHHQQQQQQQREQQQEHHQQEPPQNLDRMFPNIANIHPYFLWVFARGMNILSLVLRNKSKPKKTEFRCHACLSNHMLSVEENDIVDAALCATSSQPEPEQNQDFPLSQSTYEDLEAFLNEHAPEFLNSTLQAPTLLPTTSTPRSPSGPSPTPSPSLSPLLLPSPPQHGENYM
jgi:hypothetical protein